MKKSLLLFSLTALLLSFFSLPSSAQRWKKKKPDILYARNKKKDVSPIYVGIGTKTPSAQFHVVGSVRLEGIQVNNNLNAVLALDGSGNVFWRDISGTLANAWMLNGNTINSNHFLGTTNNDDLRIRTNNIQRVVITSAGNVGIGIAAPAAQLHTTGSVLFEGLLNNDAAPRVVTMDNSGNLSWKTVASIAGNSWLTAGNTASAANFLGTTNTEDLRLRTNNIQRAVLSSGGNFGIGVASPAAQLHTNGTVRFEGMTASNSLQRLAAFDNSGNLFYKDVSSLSSNFWSLTGNAGTNPATNFIGTTDANPVVIKTGNTEKLRVTASGQVGIGTATPQNTLHITDPNNAIFQASCNNGYGAILLQGNGSDARSFISLDNSNSTRRWLLSHRSGNSFPGQQDKLFFSFYDGTTWIEKLSFSPQAGNKMFLGIGTTSPTATLHTVDAVRFENLPSGSGSPVVIDASGNLFVGSAGSAGNAWTTTGNAGTNPAVNFIGTTDANPLIVKTNNTEKIRITSAGFIGIGTTNPLNTVHISDPSNAIFQATCTNGYGAILLQGNGSDARSFISLDNNNSTKRWLISHRSGNSFPGQQDKLFYSFFDGTNWIEKVAFAPQATNKMFLGLGTVNPTAVLHTVDAIRFENLPSGAGNVLVVDASGNVFKSSAFQSRQQVETMQKEIDALKQEVAELKKMLTGAKSGTVSVTTEGEAAVLYQNVPNPFKKSTTIRYSVPETARTAYMDIMDESGNKIKTFNLSPGSQQSVSLDISHLSSGMYYYSLTVDNKTIDTKKMILAK